MIPLAPGFCIGGRYRVLRELGRGGMGAVYLVEHVHTGEELALKVLHAAGVNDEAVERFKREARAPARIRSENVVRVTDADAAAELGGVPFMVMEALSGQNLDQHLAARGSLTALEVVSILAPVATVLDKAHTLGIVHRDLKPENLFLHRADDGRTVVKILDFGISKMQPSDASHASDADSPALTRTGALMGTPLYMSPEQARGKSADMGPAADIWALGLLAFHLLTGRIYWHATTLADLLVELLVEPMPPPSSRLQGLSPAFDAWFARSCDRDQRGRWSTAGEQVRALATALGVDVTSLALPPVVVRAPAPPRDARAAHPRAKLEPRRLSLIVSGALFAALAIGATLGWRARHRAAGGGVSTTASAASGLPPSAASGLPPSAASSAVAQTAPAPSPTTGPSASAAPTAAPVPLASPPTSPRRASSRGDGKGASPAPAPAGIPSASVAPPVSPSAARPYAPVAP